MENKQTEHDEAINVAAMMRRYGGGFVSRLGAALGHADDSNTARIKTAFSEIWQAYSEMAKREEKE